MRDVIKGLAHLAAERCLIALEKAADVHGVGAHIFPAAADCASHSLTVTFQDEGYIYRLRVPDSPGSGGVVDRETALRIIRSDKQLLAAGAINGSP